MAICCLLLTRAFLCCVQPAVARMTGVLEDPARAQRLQSCLPWLEILARLPRLPKDLQTAGYPMLVGDPKVVKATAGKLRLCKQLQSGYSLPSKNKMQEHGPRKHANQV